ncbi:hypothetical protein D7I46_00975 [Lactococcus allomyrinae]|uniref:Uncharacterized protein n=1 Tax=Lactococcus allomyrinae TaxID=2419773 RepID=A0A387B7X5_9LACT|nr:hypothetical protein D7I46_00975 [Lactococcus allomyrinae]
MFEPTYQSYVKPLKIRTDAKLWTTLDLERKINIVASWIELIENQHVKLMHIDDGTSDFAENLAKVLTCPLEDLLD